MTKSELLQEVPLETDPGGTIRLAGSRVSLDSVLAEFKQGATAEQILQSFPTLRLADIYSVISYYLSHEGEVEAYLRDQQQKGREAKRRWDAQPAVAALRSRLQAEREKAARD